MNENRISDGDFSKRNQATSIVRSPVLLTLPRCFRLPTTFNRALSIYGSTSTRVTDHSQRPTHGACRAGGTLMRFDVLVLPPPLLVLLLLLLLHEIG
jgi:hypothetical protein